jgi:hypothetical protein
MGQPRGILAAYESVGWWFATGPVNATCRLTGLPVSDGYELTGEFRFGLTVPVDATDRRMLVETFADAGNPAVGPNAGPVVDDDPRATPVETIDAATVVARFEPALARAATDVMRNHTAVDVLEGPARVNVLNALRGAGEAAAFSCGLELVGPFELTLSSPTYTADRRRATDRARAEADAAERLRHLQQAATVAREVLARRDALPPDFLQAIAESDRPAALAATLARDADSIAAPLWLVAGRSLVVIDPSAVPTGARIVCTATEAIGALRSVQGVRISGMRHLALGGQRGVELIAMPRANEVETGGSASSRAVYLDEALSSSLGFNAIAYDAAAGEIVATHSQAGVVAWPMGRAGHTEAGVMAPSRRLPDYTGAGGLCTVDDTTLAFFAGPRAFVMVGGEAREVYAGCAQVVAVVPDRGRLHVICEDGAYVTLERDTAGHWRPGARQTTGGPVTAAAALPWMGGVRLLLARRDGGLDCLGTDDTVVTRYASRHIGLRALSASGAHVAAVTTDRQRVVLWNAIDGRSPVVEINVAGTVGNRVAGIEFVEG